MRRLIVVVFVACGDNVESSPFDAITCVAPEVACSGVCVWLIDDVVNCGSCGNVCPVGEVCVIGDCQSSSVGASVGASASGGVGAGVSLSSGAFLPTTLNLCMSTSCFF